MEELALFVLPRTQDFDDDDDSGSESDRASNASSIGQQHSAANARKDHALGDDKLEGSPASAAGDERLIVGADVVYVPLGCQCVIRKVLQNAYGNFDDGADADDEQPIMSSRGRIAPSKTSKEGAWTSNSPYVVWSLCQFVLFG
jgi:hypothetical protein